MISRRTFVATLTGGLLAAPLVAMTQPGVIIPRIGFLSPSSPSDPRTPRRLGAFREILGELGYVEGQNIAIELQYAAGKLQRLPDLAKELVHLKVDVIVVGGSTATRAAKNATKVIPIVMAQADDPVASGFVGSLARPGGNITGLSTLSPELSGKRLEILKEVIPKLSRVAVFSTTSSPGNERVLSETKLAAVALGIKLQHLDVLSTKDFETAFRAASKARADGVLWLVSGSVGSGHQAKIAELAVKSRLPAIYERQNYVTAGGLISYGVSLPDLARRAATYVDKILKGTKAADLPVEQPIKFEFIVNLKAAKQIALTIPPNVLVRADRVIR